MEALIADIVADMRLLKREIEASSESLRGWRRKRTAKI